MDDNATFLPVALNSTLITSGNYRHALARAVYLLCFGSPFPGFGVCLHDQHFLLQSRLRVRLRPFGGGVLLRPSHVDHNRLEEPILCTHPITVPKELQETQD
jgi:hypothetical protein